MLQRKRWDNQDQKRKEKHWQKLSKKRSDWYKLQNRRWREKTSSVRLLEAIQQNICKSSFFLIKSFFKKFPSSSNKSMRSWITKLHLIHWACKNLFEQWLCVEWFIVKENQTTHVTVVPMKLNRQQPNVVPRSEMFPGMYPQAEGMKWMMPYRMEINSYYIVTTCFATKEIR